MQTGNQLPQVDLGPNRWNLYKIPCERLINGVRRGIGVPNSILFYQTYDLLALVSKRAVESGVQPNPSSMPNNTRERKHFKPYCGRNIRDCWFDQV